MFTSISLGNNHLFDPFFFISNKTSPKVTNELTLTELHKELCILWKINLLLLIC